MTDSEVLTSVQNGVGRITLNRPRALNALNRGMCEIMTEALLVWRGDDDVRSILIDHTGERGFCAGGDIRMIAESGAGDAVEAKAFFRVEYRLNDLMVRYPKPIVAVMDGIVMGGGVGISDPAPFRIVTERTLYAMPETGIGLFPDVGGGWFLPRMPGETGIWLALTGARIKAADCLPLEVGTHFIPVDQIEAFKLALIETGGHPAEVVSRFAGDPGPAPLAPHRETMDRCFALDTVEAVFAALDARVDLAGMTVLDLFAGTGALGLEAVSRGAASAVFVDDDGRAAEGLKRNIATCGAGQRAKVVRRAVDDFLRSTTDRYDLVFCDPPYGIPDDELAAVLAASTIDEAVAILRANGCPAYEAEVIARQERGDPEGFDVLTDDVPERPEADPAGV